mmetsp:Transcript_28651/g.37552  ORF Transcript_28651/g.37552 Transcript_28651/m.37552 type:complete len:298 (-) Transcript_28651:259-1152(-)
MALLLRTFINLRDQTKLFCLRNHPSHSLSIVRTFHPHLTKVKNDANPSVLKTWSILFLERKHCLLSCHLRNRLYSSTAGESDDHECEDLRQHLDKGAPGESPCWNCGEREKCEGFFCGCGALQPLQNANYFEILKCPVHFDVDMKYLEKNYWALQKQLHPDLYGTRHQIEQELSAENSSKVNHAYQILRDPVERVKYLLSLYGVDVLAENSSTKDVDAMFLMEVMEIRENIDDAASIESINGILESNRKETETCLKNIKSLFDSKEFEKIGEQAVRLQYFTRINAEANQKLDALEGH